MSEGLGRDRGLSIAGLPVVPEDRLRPVSTPVLGITDALG